MDGPFEKVNKLISHMNLDFRLISLSLLIFLDGIAYKISIFPLIISILMFLCGISSYKFKQKFSSFMNIKNQIKLWELISLIFNLSFLIFPVYPFYCEIERAYLNDQKEEILRYSAIEFFYLIFYKVPSYTCFSLIAFSIFLFFHLEIECTMITFLIMMNIFHICFRLNLKREKKVKKIKKNAIINLKSIHLSQDFVGTTKSAKPNHLDLNFPDTSDFILVIDRSKEVIQCNFRLTQVLKQMNIDTNYFTIYFKEWKFKIIKKLDKFPMIEELYEEMIMLFHKKDGTFSDHTLNLTDILDDLFINKFGKHFYLVLAKNSEGKYCFMHLYLHNEHALLKIIQNCVFQEWLEFRSEKLLYANHLNYLEHEFRTPLNCIINILQILEDFIEPEIASTIITPALISSKLLLNSLSNFIDFGKIKTYSYESNNVEFDLPSLLNEIIEIVKNRAANRGILIQQNFDDKIRIVKNDQTRIRQILINLLENALSLTTKGSIILSAQIIIQDQIEISVIDTGLGFYSEDQLKIKGALDKEDLKEIDVLKSNLISLGVLISNTIAQNLKGATQGLFFSSLFNEGNTFSFRFDGHKEFHIEECVTESHRRSFNNLPDNSCKMIYDVLFNNEIYSFKKEETASLQSSFFNTRKDDVTSFRQMSVCSCFSKQNSKGRQSKSSSKNSKNSKSSKFMFVSEARSSIREETLQITQEENMNFQSSSKISKTSKNSKYIFVSEARSCINEEPVQIMHETNINMEKDLQIVRNFIKLRPCQCPLALIIDDNDFNILALEFQLKRLDIISEKALSADVGIELIKNMLNNECCDTFKIIFLDIEMPIKNRFQAYEEIKSLYEKFKLNNLCVVAVTAHGQNSQIVKEAKKIGIKEVISKPLSMESLILLLMKLFKSLILS